MHEAREVLKLKAYYLNKSCKENEEIF